MATHQTFRDREKTVYRIYKYTCIIYMNKLYQFLFLCALRETWYHIYFYTTSKLLGISCAYALHMYVSQQWESKTTTKNWDEIGKIEQVCEKGKTSEECKRAHIFHFTRSSVEYNYGSLAPHSCVYTCHCVFCIWCLHANLCNFHAITQKKIILINAQFKLQWQN